MEFRKSLFTRLIGLFINYKIHPYRERVEGLFCNWGSGRRVWQAPPRAVERSEVTSRERGERARSE